MSLAKVALDHCLSPKLALVLNVLYKSQGFDFMHVESFAGPKTPDEVWADTFTRFGGQFVISGDTKIAYKPHQVIAFVDNNLTCVFLSEAWHKMQTHYHATILPFYWPVIAKKFTDLAGKPGSCWRLPLALKDGSVTLSPIELEAMNIPGDVLDQARDNSQLSSTRSQTFRRS